VSSDEPPYEPPPPFSSVQPPQLPYAMPYPYGVPLQDLADPQPGQRLDAYPGPATGLPVEPMPGGSRSRRAVLLVVVAALTIVAGVGWYVAAHRSASNPAAQPNIPSTNLTPIPSPSTTGLGSSGPRQRQEVLLAVAKAALEVLGTYDYRHLDDDLAHATAVTSGALSKTFADTFAAQTAPQARAAQRVQTTTVLAVGFVDVRPAKVIVDAFAQQDATQHGVNVPTRYLDLAASFTSSGPLSWLVSSAVADIDHPWGGATDWAPPNASDAMIIAERFEADTRNLRGAHFDEDFARAKSRMTASMQLRFETQRQALVDELAQRGGDSAAGVDTVALVAWSPTSVSLLVTSDEWFVAGGRELGRAHHLYRCTMVLTDGQWLFDSLDPVG